MKTQAIQDLIDILQAMPEYNGTIESDEMPEDMAAAAYESLSEHDDLSRLIPGARGASDPEAGMILVVPPAEVGSSWHVRFAGGDREKRIRQLEFDGPVDDDVLRAITRAVGYEPSVVMALQRSIERCWNERRQLVESENEKLPAGQWKTIPMRSDESIVEEAIINMQLGER